MIKDHKVTLLRLRGLQDRKVVEPIMGIMDILGNDLAVCLT